MCDAKIQGLCCCVGSVVVRIRTGSLEWDGWRLRGLGVGLRLGHESEQIEGVVGGRLGHLWRLLLLLLVLLGLEGRTLLVLLLLLLVLLVLLMDSCGLL